MARLKAFAAFGLILGIFLVFVSLTLLNTHFGLEFDVSNPLRQTPIVGPLLGWTGLLGPETFEQGISVENLGQIIFTGILVMLFVGIFIVALLMFLTRPNTILSFGAFAGALMVAFLAGYWLGFLVMQGALGFG